MSTSIDQQVVEMRFDNSHFEKNVSTTMSTLDKLKQRLNFSGAAKGLENVNTAAKNVNMSGLGSAVDTVHAKFSALQVVGVTALANITNSAVNAAKNVARMFTIDPVKTGFNEYELKMNSIQTIMASTGEDLATVNRYLNELNEYSDKTIYSFSDMTQNIGKFTNAGVKLEDAVAAIQGVSNVAAISGANANEASRSMYNFAQALSSGYVKLIDWKSIELANMATVDFKNQLIESAVAAGTLEKASDGMYKVLSTNNLGSTMDQTISATQNFNDSLSYQWMTTDVLVNTLRNYADETTEIGAKASTAAQKVTTFTKMMDTLKETAQSGWAQSWEIIFGDFEEGSNLWTTLTNDIFSPVINGMNDARNTFLKEVLGDAGTEEWDEWISKINDAGVATEDFQNALVKVGKKHSKTIAKMVDDEASFEEILHSGELTASMFTEALGDLIVGGSEYSEATKDMTEKLEHFQDVVDKVWQGDFKNGQERIETLTEAGYDYAEVQELINKTVDGHKLTLEDLSIAQMKQIGFTDEQIASLEALKIEAQQSGVSLDELFDKLSRKSGRTMFAEMFGHLRTELTKLVDAAKKGWETIFPDDGEEEKFSDKIYKLIEKLHEFVTAITLSEDAISNFERIVAGMGSLWDLTHMAISASMTATIKLIKAVLSLFDLDIVSFLALLADKIVALRDFVNSNTLFIGWIDKVATIIAQAIRDFSDFVKLLWNMEEVQDVFGGIADSISDFLENIQAFLSGGTSPVTNFISGLKEMEAAGTLSVDSLWGKIKEGFSSIGGIFNDAVASLQNLRDGATEKLGVVGDTFETVSEKISGFFEKIKEFTGGIDWGAITAIIMGVGLIKGVFALADAIETLLKPISVIASLGSRLVGAITGIANGFIKIEEAIAGKVKAETLLLKSQAILNIAFAIGILAAALIALTFVDSTALLKSLGIIAGLSAVIVGLVAAIGWASKMGAFDETSKVLLHLAGSLLILAVVLKIMESINPDRIWDCVAVLGVLAAGLTLVAIALAKWAPTLPAGSMFLLMFSTSLLIFTSAIENLGKLDGATIGQSLGMLMVAIVTLAMIAKICYGLSAKSALGLMALAFSLSVIAVTLMLISYMPVEHVIENLGSLIVILGMLAVIARISNLAGGSGGIGILAMAASLLIIAQAFKMIATIEVDDWLTVIGIVLGMLAVFKVVVVMSNYAGKYAARAGAMLLLMSGAMIIMVGLIWLLKRMDPTGMDQALVAISILGLVFAGMVWASRYASKDSKASLITITAALAILVVALGLLSLIDPQRLMVAAAAISIAMLAFAAISAATGKAARAKKITLTLVMLTVIVGLLGGLLYLASKLDVKASLETFAALSVLLVAMAATLVILKQMGRYSKSVTKAIGAMALLGLVVVELGVILGLMSHFGVEVSMNNMTALSLMLISMASVMLILNTLGNKQFKTWGKLVGAMACLGLVVGELGVILGLMSKYNLEASLPNVVALSVMLGALVGVMVILNTLGNKQFKTWGKLVGAMACLGLVVGELGIILGLMSKYDLEASIPNVFALSVMLYALTGVMAILNVISKHSTSVTPAITGMLGLGVVVAELGLILGVLSKLDVTISMDNVIALSTFMYAMTGVLAILSILGPMASAAYPAMVALGVLIGAAAIVLAAAAALAQIPGIQGFLDDGVELLATIGEAIGAFFGGIGAGFMTASTSGLPEVAQNLSDFMSNLQGFLDGANSIDESTLEKVGLFAEVVDQLADVKSKLTGWGNSDTSFETFKTQVIAFGEAIVGYSETISGKIDPEAVTAASGAISSFASLYEVMPTINGLMESVSGTAMTFEEFGTEIKALGEAIVAYSGAVSVEGAINTKCISNSVDAAKKIAGLYEVMPLFNGMKQLFAGQTMTFSVFAEELAALGTAIVEYSSVVSEEKAINTSAITTSINAAKEIASLYEVMPTLVGLNDLFTGATMDFVTFGTELNSLGQSLIDYSAKAAEIGDDDITNINRSIVAVKELASLKDVMPDVVSLWESICGDGSMSFSDFGSEMESLGNAIADYSESLADVDTGKISSSTSQLQRLVQMLKGLDGIDTEGTTSLKNALSELGEVSVVEFIEAFTDAHTDAADAITELLTAVATSVEDNSSTVSDAFETLSEVSVTAIKGYYDDFSTVGKYLVQGFASGISANTFLATAKATAMANAAEAAAKTALGVHSPSRVFYKIGDFAGLGFVKALGDYAKSAYKAAYDMASHAKTGLSNAVSKIADVINTDVDSQPTIRPVLDLSNIESGAGLINGMFNMQPSVGVLGNVNSVSSMMNRRIQNGANKEVVSAIDKLRRDVSNLEKPSYNINGITYDDGSAVANAIETIVRAVKIERRV